MIIGILADTHDEVARTRQAVALLREAGAAVLVHCGDLIGRDIVQACSQLPFYFVFGNHDADMVSELESSAEEYGATCLGWGGEFSVANKRIGVVHGHLTSDLKPILASQPDYLLSGHSHSSHDFHFGPTRRINPGALHRSEVFSVATLDLARDKLEFHVVLPSN